MTTDDKGYTVIEDYSSFEDIDPKELEMKEVSKSPVTTKKKQPAGPKKEMKQGTLFGSKNGAIEKPKK